MNSLRVCISSDIILYCSYYNRCYVWDVLRKMYSGKWRSGKRS